MIRAKLFSWVLFFGLFCYFGETFAKNASKCAVTYEFSGGRFGDSLLCYLHAKWISYQYDLPLFYRSFRYSDALVMHVKETPFDEEWEKSFQKGVWISDEGDVNRECSTLYYVPYFPENTFEREVERWKCYFPVNWEDGAFREKVKEMIKPRKAIKATIYPMKGKKSVAAHIRTTGAFDAERTAVLRPQKFPPLSYYVEQIRVIYDYYGHAPLHVHLFTDSLEPKLLAEKLKKRLKGCDICFTCNSSAGVVEDFFTMTLFDCLVRPASNFSLVVGVIKDFEIEIYPTHHDKVKDEVVIDGVEMIVRQ